MLSETELPVIRKLVESKALAVEGFLIVPANLLDLALKSLSRLRMSGLGSAVQSSFQTVI